MAAPGHGGLGGQPAVRHAVGGQGVKLGHTELQRMKPENIGHGLVQLGALPRQQITPRWRRKPVMQTYNSIVHEVNSTARLH